jgi:hypothetical protein
MSLHITRTFGRSLILASVALLIHIGSAAAATRRDDFQQQVQQWLSRNIATHTLPRAATRTDDPSRSSVDPQKSVREFLRGSVASKAPRPAAERLALSARSQGDIQPMVRLFLQGSRLDSEDAH